MVSTLQHLVTVIKIVTLLSLVTLAPLFDVTAATPTGNETWVDTFTAALVNKFAGILSETELNGIYLRRDGTVAMTDDLNLSNNDIINLDGIASVSTEIGNKVNKTTTIAGIDLQDNITLQEIKDAIGEATTSLSGLMSSTDKTALNNLVELLATDDADNVVNTIGEVLAIFSQYPEGADLVTALGDKVDVEEGKGLSANDFTTALKEKLEGIAASAEVNVQANWTEEDTESDAFILNKPSIYTQTELNEGQLDTRYYTETELNDGQLDTRYFTETELTDGQLDTRYYTETELDGGQLDGRYYTEGEVDSLLADKVNLSDLQTTLTVYPTTTAEVGGTFDGYFQMVTSTSDNRFDTNFVEIYTTDDTTATGNSLITSTDPNNPSVVGLLIADAQVFETFSANTNVTTVGQVKKHSGNPNFKIHV
jgi:uncharacterized protein YbjQ (UPF0145 family)